MEIAAVIFLLVALAFAYVAFRLLKKTVRFAIRAIITLLIILAAIVGGSILYNLDFEKSPVSSPSRR